MGSLTTVAASSSSSSGSSTPFLILIVVAFVVFYFLLIRPQRNRQRKVMEQQKTVQPGARVRTTAGMYATVVAVDGDDVVLEVAPGVETRYMKRAIMEVIGEGPGVPVDETAEDETEDAVDEAADPEAHAEDGPAHPAESDPEITVYHSGNGSASGPDGEADAKSGSTASKE